MNKHKSRRIGAFCLSLLMAGCLEAQAQKVSFNAGSVTLKVAFHGKIGVCCYTI